MTATLIQKDLIQQNQAALPQLAYMPLGKRTHLYRLLYAHGPGNGTLQLLPIDHGLEHGPIDFLTNPASEDPTFQCQLAVKGNFSGIAMHYGLAEKAMPPYAGQIPLIIKLNGKTNIPPATHPFSGLTSRVEDAVRLGADAVGYTLYVGSPDQAQDIEQFMLIREEAERFGLPVIMWAYPRGEDIDKKGGDKTLYAIDYAARVACELGADIVKLQMPEPNPPGWQQQPKPYQEIQSSLADNMRKVVRSAGSTLVIFSGGKEVADDELLKRTQVAMEGGATGVIFGRNIWQRPFDQALDLSRQITRIIQTVSSERGSRHEHAQADH